MDKTKKISALRNVRTRKEQGYWVLAQDELQLQKGSKLLSEWKTISCVFTSVLSGKFENKFIEEHFENFFGIRAADNIIKPTTIYGSPIDVLLILNGPRFPIEYDTSTKLGKTNNREAIINPRTVLEFAEVFQECMGIVKSNQELTKAGWKLLDHSLRSGVQYYSFHTPNFQYNIFPALKSIDGSYLLLFHDGEENSRCLFWIESDLRLRLANENYYGFFELIKFCKVVLHDWNVNNPNSVISPLAFETIGYHVQNEMEMSTWNDSGKETFDSLFKLFMNQFKQALLQGTIPSLCSSEINLIGNLDSNAIAQVVQWIDNLPNSDSNHSLLDFVKRIWTGLVSSAPLTSSPVPLKTLPAAVPTPMAEDNNNNSCTESHKNAGTIPGDMGNYRVYDLLQKEHRLQQLEEVLYGSWQKLAIAFGKTNTEISKIEKVTQHDHQFSPIKALIEEWYNKKDATVHTLMKIFQQIDNHSACELIAKWVSEMQAKIPQ